MIATPPAAAVRNNTLPPLEASVPVTVNGLEAVPTIVAPVEPLALPPMVNATLSDKSSDPAVTAKSPRTVTLLATDTRLALPPVTPAPLIKVPADRVPLAFCVMPFVADRSTVGPDSTCPEFSATAPLWATNFNSVVAVAVPAAAIPTALFASIVAPVSTLDPPSESPPAPAANVNNDVAAKLPDTPSVAPESVILSAFTGPTTSIEPVLTRSKVPPVRTSKLPSVEMAFAVPIKSAAVARLPELNNVPAEILPAATCATPPAGAERSTVAPDSTWDAFNAIPAPAFKVSNPVAPKVPAFCVIPVSEVSDTVPPDIAWAELNRIWPPCASTVSNPVAFAVPPP